MKLTPEQEQLVREWAAQGDSLSDIQTKLADECDVHISYLDTRFLLIDLSVSVAEKNPKKEAKKEEAAPPPAPTEEPAPAAEKYPTPPAGGPFASTAASQFQDALNDAADDYPPPANVTVELSRIQRPGYALSGSVVWTDGTKSEWAITNDGRIALDTALDKGYKPTTEDLQDFQMKLRDAISSGGAGLY